MHKWISGFIAATALIACTVAFYWQVEHAHAARFSFLFATAVCAVVCLHWLAEEFDLVRHQPPSAAGEF